MISLQEAVYLLSQEFIDLTVSRVLISLGTSVVLRRRHFNGSILATLFSSSPTHVKLYVCRIIVNLCQIS